MWNIGLFYKIIKIRNICDILANILILAGYSNFVNRAIDINFRCVRVRVRNLSALKQTGPKRRGRGAGCDSAQRTSAGAANLIKI